MSFILAAVLIVVGIVGAAIVAIAAPVLVTFMMFEVMKSDEGTPVEVEHTPMRIAIKRGIARGFVIGGGAFWSIAGVAGWYSFRQTGVRDVLLAALLPVFGCAVTIVVGWYYERVVAALLLAASLGVFVFGVIYEFEPAVWMMTTFALFGPMLTASVLFWLARRDQEAFETAFSFQPQMHPLFAARSTLATVTAE